MNVSMDILKKTHRISKIFNKVHNNLQVTDKVFEKMYFYSTEIIIALTYLQEKLNIIRIQCLNFETNDMKSLIMHIKCYKNYEISYQIIPKIK